MDYAIMGGTGINTQSFSNLITIAISACRRVGWREQPIILSGGGTIGGGRYYYRIRGVLCRGGFKLGACLTFITVACEPFVTNKTRGASGCLV